MCNIKTVFRSNKQAKNTDGVVLNHYCIEKCLEMQMPCQASIRLITWAHGVLRTTTSRWCFASSRLKLNREAAGHGCFLKPWTRNVAPKKRHREGNKRLSCSLQLAYHKLVKTNCVSDKCGDVCARDNSAWLLMKPLSLRVHRWGYC